ncbi:DUF488 family protein [Desulfofundulus thermobenzoicus]|uniref:DUF488 family protein n=1 Tax=Desulfofundulus thermobenzoicus TaxID=29376 RepID=A0A6N7IPP9_9FIRM|nr:DUF488 domain-containing protein [Desulfofundulus thermobenzoicus]MQL51950.1 DUF488 family protein [Desulfofundulus thermobenzoicus]HHW42691.1 DUF488 domain-containing protein [Desulfotomaculum sp.]
MVYSQEAGQKALGKKLCTIGFSRKSLRRFIELLKEAGVQRVVDVRLHNTSQLAGFAKKEDLEYILSLVEIDYIHLPGLAPPEELLRAYQGKKVSWNEYQREFLKILEERRAEECWGREINPKEINCLLCTEDRPEHCHRRLVAEYLVRYDPAIVVEHLF